MFARDAAGAFVHVIKIGGVFGVDAVHAPDEAQLSRGTHVVGQRQHRNTWALAGRPQRGGACRRECDDGGGTQSFRDLPRRRAQGVDMESEGGRLSGPGRDPCRVGRLGGTARSRRSPTLARIGAKEGNLDNCIRVFSCHFMTPETEASCVDYWLHVRNFGTDDPAVGEGISEQFRIAFAEDKVVLEAIQREEEKFERGPA